MACTSRWHFLHIAPILYADLYVDAPNHPNIPKFIKTLQPYLTIRQKKSLLQLKTSYRGQQTEFPSGADEDAQPINASYVRSFELGVSHPGRLHRPAVIEYAQEALSCFKNLKSLT